MNGIVTSYKPEIFKIFYKYAKDKFDYLYVYIGPNDNLYNIYKSITKSHKSIIIIRKKDLKKYYNKEYFKNYYKSYMTTFHKVYIIKYLLDKYNLNNFFFLDDDIITKELNYFKTTFFKESGLHKSVDLYKNKKQNEKQILLSEENSLDFYKKWIYNKNNPSSLKYPEELLSPGQFYIKKPELNIFYNKMKESIDSFLEDIEKKNYHREKRRGKRNSNYKIFFSDNIYLNYLFKFLNIKKSINIKSDVLFLVSNKSKFKDRNVMKKEILKNRIKIIHFNILDKLEYMIEADNILSNV